MGAPQHCPGLTPERLRYSPYSIKRLCQPETAADADNIRPPATRQRQDIPLRTRHRQHIRPCMHKKRPAPALLRMAVALRPDRMERKPRSCTRHLAIRRTLPPQRPPLYPYRRYRVGSIRIRHRMPPHVPRRTRRLRRNTDRP